MNLQTEARRVSPARANAPRDSVAIVSGGLDSTTLVYEMLTNGMVPHLISFDYGQRHKKELHFAAATAKQLNLPHDIIDLSGLTHLISNSALTASNNIQHVPEIDVPEGHYAEDNMKQTVVPNRNMIMLSIAAGIAVNNNYTRIATGVHAGDHFIYPDCRPEFIQAANKAIIQGNKGFGTIPDTAHMWEFVYAPFLTKTKADIAYRALQLGVPLHMTWSCYKGGANHCGRCGTCVERLEAIEEAQERYRQSHGMLASDRILDGTVYDDPDYWKGVINK